MKLAVESGFQEGTWKLSFTFSIAAADGGASGDSRNVLDRDCRDGKGRSLLEKRREKKKGDGEKGWIFVPG